MSLYLNYIRKTDLELIEILEFPENYKQEALDAVNEIFIERQITPEELHEMVLHVNRKKAIDIIHRLVPYQDHLRFHESIFLDSQEVRDIYISLLKKHMDQKEGFKFNVQLGSL